MSPLLFFVILLSAQVLTGDGATIIGCAHSVLSLNCASDTVIHIIAVNYGRHSSTLCPSSNPTAMQNTACSYDETSRYSKQSEETYMTAPWNFSWIVPSKLAAMGWPQTPANIKFLYSEGIRHLVTLSPEMRPPLRDPHFTNNFISWTEIAVEEFEPPTVQQIHNFISVCELANNRQESVGVHCRMGRGRTGVMAACYLVHFLDQPPQTAISNVRRMRPYSVETSQQEHIVKDYHDYIRSL